MKAIRQPLDDLPSVARSAFSERESEELLSLREDEQSAAFYQVWTRKEAVLKAVGTGLSLPSRSFDVSVLPGQTPRLISAPLGVLPAANWTLVDVSAAVGFAAAVAVECPAAQIVVQDLLR